jgi:FkbH-like protein
MQFDPLHLVWLEQLSADASAFCRSLKDKDNVTGADIASVARYALDEKHARMLGRVIQAQIASGTDLSPLSGFKLAVLSNTTFDFIADALPAAAARHGTALNMMLAPLDQIEQQIFDNASQTAAFKADAVLVAVDYNWLGMESFNDHNAARAEDAVARIEMIIDGINDNQLGLPIITTMAVPPRFMFGSFDPMVRSSLRSAVDAFNRRLAQIAAQKNCVLLDVAGLAEYIGTSRWFDRKLWNLYKLPFTPDAVPLYADWLARILGAIRGKARKCLVLDLDNTMWGGVIGDDGMSGIRIGQGSAEGESFLAIQKLALSYKARGIILAVSSKNNDDTAREPFRDHPDMALRENDIAVFQANWLDKSSNLEAIAATLNIGLDALVFLDDNAAERAQVRAALPMVAVPELPADPALYPDYLNAAGYFEAIAFSDEDKNRAASYASNAQRADVKAKSRNLGDYLNSLAMKIECTPFDAIGRPRIVQLINKSNQFNLTTRRYTEQEIALVEAADDRLSMQVRMSDKFGDFGMIGVVIAKIIAGDSGHNSLNIDSWLMSCRVLGRKVEEAMFAHIIAFAAGRGIATIKAEYIPTAKNNMVSEHYEKLGFALIDAQGDGRKTYQFDVASYQSVSLPFEGMMHA